MRFQFHILFICFGLFGTCLTWSLSCSKSSDCRSVSQNIRYVSCSNNQCKCRYWNGFSGDANLDSKCSCSLQVVNVNNDVFCINLKQALNGNKQLAYQEKNKQAIKSLYTDLLDTNIQASIAKLLNNEYPSYFAPNCKGRATPLGYFIGIKGVTEYFYASVYASGAKISKFTFVDMIAEGNKVYYRVDTVFTSPRFPNPTNYTQLGRFRFNSDSQIESMDFANTQLGLLLDNVSNHTLRTKAICGVANYYCKGNNIQYSSFEQCAEFLASIPEGSWSRANSNSVICREYHAWLASVDPDMHCAHIGPSGGGACIDTPYAFYYELDF